MLRVTSVSFNLAEIVNTSIKGFEEYPGVDVIVEKCSVLDSRLTPSELGVITDELVTKLQGGDAYED